MHDEPSTADLARLLAPFLAATALATALIVLVVLRFVPMFNPVASPEVVTFDVVKYTNSQRAVASAFLKKDADIGQANELLLELPERTRKAVAEVAGSGVVVVVKQSVVQGTTRDITDEVLGKLGLPKNVPTSDATAYSLDAAPTMMLRPVDPRRPEPLPGEQAGASSAKVLP